MSSKIIDKERFIYKIFQSPAILKNLTTNNGFCTGVSCNSCSFSSDTGRCTIQSHIPSESMLDELVKVVHAELDLDQLESKHPELLI